MQASTQIIADEWRSRADVLAHWAMDHLVNRRDVWGQYVPMSRRTVSASGRVSSALTLPAPGRRGEDMVTLEKLARHFRGADVGHVIGLHSASAENTSRWLAIDIDLHDPGADDASEIAGRNYVAALGWWQKLRAMGLDPLLFDSNGAGGYHLWTLFDRPYPTADVRAFGLEVVSDYRARNFSARPEVFPKNTEVTLAKPGSWLRLPGRHHTREHFSRVWSGDEWLDSPWLDGVAAIEVMLSTRGQGMPSKSGDGPA